MIDCGEGTQMQLRKFHIHFNKLTTVFISHLHGDHCFGLIGMISTFGMLGRTAPLHVYAPKELEAMLDAQMRMFCNGLDFVVKFHAVDTTQKAVIYEDRTMTVESIPLQHRIPCCGFLFKEKPTLPHIRREVTDYYQISPAYFMNIKNGEGWTTDEGEFIPHERLTRPADPPRSYAYCSDTRYIPTLHEMIMNVSTLYHESTYSTEQEDRAKMYNHSTAREAALVARAANAGKLLIGHYSARYNDEQLLLREARSVFPNTFLTDEKMVFDV